MLPGIQRLLFFNLNNNRAQNLNIIEVSFSERMKFVETRKNATKWSGFAFAKFPQSRATKSKFFLSKKFLKNVARLKITSGPVK